MPEGLKGFQPGNQLAVGKGRPHNPGFSDEELIVLGEELLSWLKDNDSVVHLSEFYSHLKGIALTQWRAICVRECFLPYYEKSSQWMGVKILKNKELSTAYGSRFLSMYHKDLREHEREISREKVSDEVEARGKDNVVDGGEIRREILVEREVQKRLETALLKRGISLSDLATQQPLLDQDSGREQDPVSNELGAARAFLRTPHV